MKSPVKTFTLRLPIKLWDAIAVPAREKGFTLNQLILQILWEWIEKQEKKAG